MQNCYSVAQLLHTPHSSFPAICHPSAATDHPSPVTRHPPPATRRKVLPSPSHQTCCRLSYTGMLVMYNWFKLPVRTLQWNTYFLRYLEYFSRYSENVKEIERKKIENFQKHIYAILRDVCVQVLSVMTMITTTIVCLARFHSFTWYCGEWTSPRLKLMIYDVTPNSHSIYFFLHRWLVD